MVAATPAAWEGLSRSVARVPPIALPDETIAVGIFLGMRRTAGYPIDIVSATESGAAFVVVYEERTPTGPVLMVITFPNLIRLFPEFGLSGRVEKRR